ncbi:unnamed protein product [Darwinula stevensoni]|uniref:CARD domain-containing protein n=1 Tax=Darwinula stevensoni TaxID=69355 RepID=A0A7R9FQV3_9CRUS|nr:unnamed protein product [Darwinula stevensoni]CAG0899849.1 unnamed protein product [Darwinula stevensoni]
MRRNMSSWDRIKQNRMKLRDVFNLDPNELRRRLSEKRVITDMEDQQIRRNHDLKEQYDELFRILSSKNTGKCVTKFYEALTDMDRDDIIEFLQGTTGLPNGNRDAQSQESACVAHLSEETNNGSINSPMNRCHISTRDALTLQIVEKMKTAQVPLRRGVF